jgi:hypothetical protein
MHTKYFKPPFKFSFGSTKVFTDDFCMAFDFECDGMSKDDKQGLIDILNGEDKKFTNDFKFEYIGDDIKLNGNPFACVRSWGRLTGTGGGLGLPPSVAADIQDSFAIFIVEKWNAACISQK